MGNSKMNQLRRQVLVALAGITFGLFWLGGQSAEAAELDVALISPNAGVPIFGEIEMIAKVLDGDGTEKAEFFVDGIKAGESLAPPYRVVINIGEENREHRFEVRVTRQDGESAEAVTVSPAFRVDIEVDVELQQLYVTVIERRIHMCQSDPDITGWQIIG